MTPEDIKKMLADGQRYEYEAQRFRKCGTPMPWWGVLLLVASFVYLLTT